MLSKHNHTRRVLALLLAVLMTLALLPTTALAGQEDGYHDPAERWMNAVNRTNELDVNATVTYETFHCSACHLDTSFRIWRTPEYTHDGQTAMTRNIRYSDGTLYGGEGTGVILDGTPGVDATYTSYHWTKSCCTACGTLNSNIGSSDYSFGKNVYWLYDCAAEFTEQLDDVVTYAYADATYHTKSVDGGTYCEFCYGTRHTHEETLERHTLHTDVLPQLDKQRFAIVTHCELCDYADYEFVAAKAVVADYYGVVDGQAHTITVTDLSESGVSARIRYGNAADICTLATPPSYTEEGQYTVYYSVTYTYQGVSMEENGVAYVWLRDDSLPEFPGCGCGCGDPDCDCGNGGDCPHCRQFDCTRNIHNFIFIDTVPPTCTTLGYDRWFCPLCGLIEKRSYVNASGHVWQSVVIREADCEHGGKVLDICQGCGETRVTVTEKGEHAWQTFNVEATCTSPGYTLSECSRCGERRITNIGAVLGHSYQSYVTPATCVTGGMTLHICDRCGQSYADNYTEAKGHRWNTGEIVTEPSCVTEGLKTYTCETCGAVKSETLPATGHKPGPASTCTEVQLCTVCGAVLDQVTGHNYTSVVTAPTCERMGYTTYTCVNCGDTVTGDYTDALGHSYTATVTAPTCTEMGRTTYTCSRCHGSYEDHYLPALGHDWDKGTVIASATCNGAGVVEHRCTRCAANYLEATDATGHKPGPAATCTEAQLCTVCGAVITPAKGHRYAATVTAPTCSTMGYTTYVCKDCDDSYRGDYTDALGHSYTATVTPPTCLTDGYTTYTCTRCGNSYVTDRVAATGHRYDSGTVLVKPSCTTDGVRLYVCTGCDKEHSEAIPATGHTSGAAATCTEAQYCTTCGVILTAAHGHAYKTERTEATCEGMGWTTYTCEVCGLSYRADYADALGHSYTANVTPPTCTEPGYTTYTCTRCGNSYVDGYTAPKGHRWDFGTKLTDATCTGDGVMIYRCRDCSAAFLKAISATGHTPDEAATCTEPQLCAVCGAVLNPAKGHRYTATVTEPTCKTMGYTAYTCADCGDSYRADYVDALGHDFEAVITAPTCTEEGYTTYTCTRCGESFITDRVEATGHRWDDGTILVKPSCTGEGLLEFRCTVCDKTRSETLPALGHVPGEEATCTEPQLCDVCGAVLARANGHSYTAEVTEPTCEQMGYTIYTCSDCGDRYKADYTDPIGHAYEADVTEPTCTEAGYTTWTCANCGDSFIDSYVEPLGHDWDEGTAITDATCNGNQYDILGIVDGSFLEEYDDFNVGAAFRNAAVVSTTYALLSRCGLEPEEYFTHEDFLNVFDFNTPATVAALGTAVSVTSEQVLRQIEVTIKNYEREKLTERSQNHDRADLSEERGLSDPRPDADRTDADAPRQIRADAEALPSGASPGAVESDDPERNPVPAPAGDRRGGDQPDGADDPGAGESGGRDGGAESLRPAEMDWSDEHLQGPGGRNDSGRADLQLNGQAPVEAAEQFTLFPSEAEQLEIIEEAESAATAPFAFSLPQEDIDLLLLVGSNTEDARTKLTLEFMKQKPMSELTAFVKQTFHDGYGLITDHGKLSSWAAEDGLHIQRGSSVRYARNAQILSWEDAAARIGELLKQGRFATNVELAEAPGYERREAVKSLWYLCHDMSDDARQQGWLPLLRENEKGGFPDATERLTKLIEDPNNRQIFVDELRAFTAAWEQDQTLMRFRLYRPDVMLQRIEELSLPRREYVSDMAEQPSVPSFITEDEIDATLSRGGGYSGATERIYTFWQQNHTPKEKAAFLKDQYGTGGGNGKVSHNFHSWEDHGSKGITLKKPDAEEVFLSWSKVVNRIDALMAKDRYLTPERKAAWEKAHTEQRTTQPESETSLQPEPEPTPNPPARKLTQEDIDQQLRTMFPDIETKRAVVRYMEAHGREKETAAWLAQQYYNSDLSQPLHISLAGRDGGPGDTVTLSWPKIQRRIAQLIKAGQFYTQEEYDNLDDVDPVAIREHLAQAGIVNGQVTGPEALDRDPFIQQVKADAEKIAEEAPEQKQPPEKKRPGQSRAERNFRSFARQFPEIVSGEYRYLELRQGEDSGYMPLTIQRIAEDEIAIAHFYEQNGDLMYDPEMTFRLDVEKGTLEPLTFRQDGGFPIYQQVYPEPGKWIPKLRNDLNAFAEQWLKNIEQQNRVRYRAIAVRDGEDVEIAFDENGQPVPESTEPSEERQTQIKEAFRAARLEYDDIDSYDGYLIFRDEGGVAYTFQFWDEAAEWLNGVVFDDPELDARDPFPLDENAVSAEKTGVETPETEAAPVPEGSDTGADKPEKTGDFTPYSVGDTVYLENTAYQITEISDFDVQLRDPAQRYPIFRSENRERFERELYRDRRNAPVTDFLAANLDKVSGYLRDALTWEGGLLDLRDKEQISDLFRRGAGNASAASYLAANYGGRTIEMTMPSGDAATLTTDLQALDLTVRDQAGGLESASRTSWESIAPILRAMYQQDRNGFFRERELAEPEPMKPYREETVAVYPGEENGLPFDIIVQEMHFDEPEHTPPTPPAPPAPAAENFRILDDHLGEGGPKEKFWRNIKAITTLRQIEAENRQATPEEQHILSQYVGWGGLADAFDSEKTAWKAEYSELKGLLTEKEYAAARASTLNAHYTSPTVIRAIYEAVGRMGFQTGNILEPSMGVGNFFGMLPEEMRGSRLYGVELDSITGRIAQKLYPKANITVAGFETTDRRDFFDLAVGNVPFGQYQVDDRAYNKLGFSIHNYFFAKALDHVRPGGVVAFVTSRYTMDGKDTAVRKYLAQRAELLGAIRLPNNAFRANAGTDVVSDIIFLQKRDHPIDTVPEWVYLGQNEDGFSINSYFVSHPEMILGRPTSESTQYGRQDFTVEPIEGLELGDQLHVAIKYIHGTYQEAELPELGEGEAVSETLPADPNVKNYSYTVVDGEVYYRENSIMVKPELNATAKERVRGMVELRNCVRNLIDLQMDEYTPDNAIRDQQAELNRLYDAFASRFGLINDRANRLAFADDDSYYLLCSLEVLDENGALERKADFFTKRTIKQQHRVDHVDTPTTERRRMICGSC